MQRVVRLRQDPAVRRERILELAIGLIGERGYDGLTVQELARRAGLSNAGLLHHFPSKQHVLVAVLDELEAQETEVMEPLVDSALHEEDGARARAAIREVLRVMVARCSLRPDIVRALAEIQGESLDPSHPAHEWWRRREVVLRDLLVALLSPHVAEAATVTRQIIALHDGLAMQWLRADRGFDIAAEWDRALARLLPELNREDQTC